MHSLHAHTEYTFDCSNSAPVSAIKVYTISAPNCSPIVYISFTCALIVCTIIALACTLRVNVLCSIAFTYDVYCTLSVYMCVQLQSTLHMESACAGTYSIYCTCNVYHGVPLQRTLHVHCVPMRVLTSHTAHLL